MTPAKWTIALRKKLRNAGKPWNLIKAGRRGQVDRVLSPGDIVGGLKSQPWESDYSIGFFPSSSLLHFLHHGSDSGLSHVVPLWGSTHLWHQLPAMEKKL